MSTFLGRSLMGALPRTRLVTSTSQPRTNYSLNPSPTSLTNMVIWGVATQVYTVGDSPGVGRVRVTIPAGATADGISVSVPVPVNGAFTGSVAVRWVSDTTDIPIWLRVNYTTGPASPIALLFNTLTNAWQSLTAAVTSDPLRQVTTVEMFLRFVSAHGAIVFDVAHSLLEASPNAMPYFDGDTPSDADYAYSWSGAPNASPSIATPLH